MKKDEKKSIISIIGFILSIISGILAILLPLSYLVANINAGDSTRGYLTDFSMLGIITFIFIGLSFVFNLIGLKKSKDKDLARVGLIISLIVGILSSLYLWSIHRSLFYMIHKIF